MEVACPHCHREIDVAGGPGAETLCPSCSGAMRLPGASRDAAALPRLRELLDLHDTAEKLRPRRMPLIIPTFGGCLVALLAMAGVITFIIVVLGDPRPEDDDADAVKGLIMLGAGAVGFVGVFILLRTWLRRRAQRPFIKAWTRLHEVAAATCAEHPALLGTIRSPEALLEREWVADLIAFINRDMAAAGPLPTPMPPPSVGPPPLPRS